MPISNTDIKFRFSTVAAAGDTTAGGASTSLGDQVATNGPTTNVANNVFDDISVAESVAGRVEYRCLFGLNDHATLTLIGAVLSISSQVAGGASVQIGLDPTGITAKGASGAQAVTVANETTAPAGVTFSGGPLTIGDLAPGQVQAFWIKRTITAGTPGPVADGATFAIDGETNP
jgi:hypothetical protein